MTLTSEEKSRVRGRRGKMWTDKTGWYLDYSTTSSVKQGDRFLLTLKGENK